MLGGGGFVYNEEFSIAFIVIIFIFIFFIFCCCCCGGGDCIDSTWKINMQHTIFKQSHAQCFKSSWPTPLVVSYVYVVYFECTNLQWDKADAEIMKSLSSERPEFPVKMNSVTPKVTQSITFSTLPLFSTGYFSSFLNSVFPEHSTSFFPNLIDLTIFPAAGVSTAVSCSSLMMMKWCLMSSDVSWHIRDKLRPMPKHGSIILYVHGNQKAR